MKLQQIDITICHYRLGEKRYTKEHMLAYVINEYLAVHRNRENNKYWCLTHLKVGGTFANLITTRKEAIKRAAMVMETGVSMDFDKDQFDKMNKKDKIKLRQAIKGDLTEELK